MQLISIGQFHKVIEKYLYWLSLPSIGFTDILEIIIISVIVYQMLKWVQLTRAWTLFKGIIMLLLFALFAAIFQLNTISWLLSNSLGVGITAAIIIFQPELRRALEQLGRKKIFSNLFSFSTGEYDGRQSVLTEKTINEIVRASYEMGAVKTGALMVIEQNVALGEYVRTGISIDGIVSSQLLINIFEHNTPLHDGAVIIRGNRIVSATCYLPLTDSMDIGKELGTRHRAAVGISEVSDSLTIIVSEETGAVSLAKDGNLYKHLKKEELLEKLKQLKIDEENNTDVFKNGRTCCEMKSQKNNMWMKILSVVIAVLIWLFVANTNDPVVTKRFYSIPVKVMNEDALTKRGYAYEILDGEEVNITVKGKSSIVRSMGISDFQAIADFSKLSKVDAVPIDVTAKKYSDQLDITLGTTNTMKIKKDEVVTISVPVNVTAKGDPAEGYAVGRVTSTPNLIKVSGPENLLSSAKEIRATVSVDGISHDVTATDKPVLYDEEGKKIISNQIEFDTASIGIYIELWKTKTVDVKLSYTGEPAKNYHLVSFDYEPKQITIAAPDDMLESLDSITLDSVSIEGLTEDYEKDIDLTQTVLPDNVILANDDTSDVKVKATIEKITSHKLSFTKKDINITNNTNNYKVSFDKDNDYSILVDGAASAVKNLDIKDFVPWIDINGLEPGTHEVSLHVKDAEGVTVGATKLKITLKENN